VIAPQVLVLGYDDAAAAWRAPERARWVAMGKPLSFMDGQIAAIARVNAKALSIEDWRSG